MAKIQSTIEGRRWSRNDLALEKYATTNGLALQMKRETGWLTEKVRFTLIGSGDAIARANGDIKQGIGKWKPPTNLLP